jgi:hypothetical protein
LRSASLVQRFIRWLTFTVLVSVLPIFAGWLAGQDRHRSVPVSNLLGHGALLIICVTMCATAAGELIHDRSQVLGTLKIIMGGLAILLALLSALWYADVAATALDASSLDATFVSTGSLLAFASAVVVSTLCICLAEV